MRHSTKKKMIKSFVPPNFSIFQRNFEVIYRNSSAIWNVSECFCNIIHQIFSHQEKIKIILDKILLDNKMTHLPFFFFWKKDVYDRESKILSKTSNSSVLDCLCSSSSKFFQAVLSILKSTNLNFQKMRKIIYMLFLNKPENMF